MSSAVYLFGIILLFVIFIIINRESNKMARASIARQSFVGVWSAPPDFCKGANLQSMTLMILPEEKKNTHKGYLVASRNDGVIVSNQPVQIRTHFGSRPTEVSPGTFSGHLNITYLQNKIWPGKLQFMINPITSHLQLFDASKTWGVLYRDGAASSVLV